MASVSGKDQEKNVMADAAASGADESDRQEREARERALEYHARQAAERQEAAAAGGFFSVRKTGQGYWTRMGTAGAVAILLAYTGQFLYRLLKVKLLAGSPPWIAVAIVAAVIGGLALVAWWLMNRAGSVDFLIATDSEMRKVNWTSRKELIGSTKVVIGFMFLIAIFLFVVDLVFWVFFWLIGVMKITPPFIG